MALLHDDTSPEIQFIVFNCVYGRPCLASNVTYVMESHERVKGLELQIGDTIDVSSWKSQRRIFALSPLYKGMYSRFSKGLKKRKFSLAISMDFSPQNYIFDSRFLESNGSHLEFKIATILNPFMLPLMQVIIMHQMSFMIQQKHYSYMLSIKLYRFVFVFYSTKVI